MLKLPNDLNSKCWLYGIHMRDHYARGGSPNSRAVSSHGMEDNEEGLADAKRCECIFALEMGLDPLTALKWNAGNADGGWDLKLGNYLIDVKGTTGLKRYLIYPYRKWAAGVFDSTRADLFVLTKINRFNEGTQTEGRSVGWCAKETFRRKHHIADGQTPRGLTTGTPYLDEDELDGMGTFPAKRPPWSESVEQAKAAIREGKQFEFICGRWP